MSVSEVSVRLWAQIILAVGSGENATTMQYRMFWDVLKPPDAPSELS